MHHQPHALAVGVLVEAGQVEVGVGCLEVEHVVLLVAAPVLPPDVPSLDEHLVEAVACGEVDVLFHVGRVGGVVSVGLHLGVVRLVQFDRGQVPGVGPGSVAGDHLPPDADVLRRLNPGGVVELAGLVEVEDELRGQDVARVVADHHRAPGAVAGCLEVALAAVGVGVEPRLEDEGRIVQVEVHTGVVHEGGFVQVDVQAVVRLHL